MNTKWNEFTISAIGDVIGGGTPSTKHDEYYNDEIAWITPKDLSNFKGRYISRGERSISQKGYDNSSAQMMPAGTVLFSSRAPIGYVAIAKNELCTNQGFKSVVPHPEVCDSEFLYYLLCYRKHDIEAIASGTTFMEVSGTALKNFVVRMPDISTQKKIASVLSSLDKRIEGNNLINHNLEEQAKAIFKSWFLDFSALDNPDFYSYEGVTCPVGWRVSYLADIADYLNGLAMQKYRPDEGDFGYPVLKIKELRQRMCDKDSERCSFHIKPEYIVHDGDVIFSWSGSLLVDFWCGGECGLNQHLFKVSSTKYDKWFYYSWTQYHLNEFIAIAADKATTMGHIKREHLQSATVLVPPADIYNEIGKLLGPIYEAITRNRIESKMLAQLRDSLLPKLMSGEIDVSEVEV